MTNLKMIEGIADVYGQKLQLVGVGTTHALLEKGASPQERKEIAEKSGISETLILR